MWGDGDGAGGALCALGWWHGVQGGLGTCRPLCGSQHSACTCSVAGGELFERIVDDDFEHTEPSSTQYMRQILEGLQYMHGQAVVHLDLKPENIVCVSPASHWLKIIDFGLARKLGE